MKTLIRTVLTDIKNDVIESNIDSMIKTILISSIDNWAILNDIAPTRVRTMIKEFIPMFDHYKLTNASEKLNHILDLMKRGINGHLHEAQREAIFNIINNTPVVNNDDELFEYCSEANTLINEYHSGKLFNIKPKEKQSLKCVIVKIFDDNRNI